MQENWLTKPGNQWEGRKYIRGGILQCHGLEEADVMVSTLSE